jgi:hypothetical protein
MNLKQLAIQISEYEGLKHECNIADITEILSVICKLEAASMNLRLIGDDDFDSLPSELIARRGAVILQKSREARKKK